METTAKKGNGKKIILIVLAILVIIRVLTVPGCVSKRIFGGDDQVDEEPFDSFAILRLYGTIQADATHEDLMDYVDYLIEDDTNHGIFLVVDSGGGAVYESDEFYLKLLEYKEKTGRPVHAYFESTAASGAYYIACAADYISRNRNCMTGSIGVIISYYNYAGLFEKFGVKEEIISSGPNKAMGHSGIEMTDEQRAIFQSYIDESYEQFIGIVAEGRKMDIETVRPIADGRIYTALQAKDLGLIDRVETYDEAMVKMEKKTGYEGFEPTFYEPLTLMDLIYGKFEEIRPKSDLEILKEMASSEYDFKPMYMYIP